MNNHSKLSQLRPPWFSDLILLSVVTVLVIFSLIMIYSATGTVAQERYGDTFYFVKRQTIAAVFGLILLVTLAGLRLEWVKKYSSFFIWACIALLALTFIPGIGDRSGGAQRWLNLGILRFQPAELVKLLFITFMANYFARHELEVKTFKSGIFIPMCYVALIAGLLLMQPDFGSSAIVALVVLGMALAAGARLIYFFYSVIGLVCCALPLIILSPYRMARITAFLNPFEDPAGKGYQLVQSLIAIGTGQLAGVGIGGSQQKLFFLPAAHTDFIFSVISEELGFMGSLCIIFIFLVLLWRGLGIAGRVANDTFAYSLAVGLILLIVIPALLNMGVTTGLLPTKGLVLPLIAYGGTSLLSSLAAIGLLLAVGRSVYFKK